MKKAAVVVGVNQTGLLPVLGAAVHGAEKFAAWAGDHGFDVTLLTDAKKQVRLSQVQDVIETIVDARNCSQLIVHFSGHGLLCGTYELWMLSRAPSNPTEAVNVPDSIQNARNAGIPHVAFFSDACRSLPNRQQLMRVKGGSLFPVREPQLPRPEVDTFYATLLGEPAYELTPSKAARNFGGLFTDCVLDALGGHPKALEIRRSPRPACRVVSGYSLKRHLVAVMPIKSGTYGLKLEQNPDIIVESRLPTCFAEFPCEKKVERRGKATLTRSAMAMHPLETIDRLSAPVGARRRTQWGAGPVGTLAGELPRILAAGGVAEGARRLLRAKGRESFETSVGFTVIGAGVKQVWTLNSAADVFRENRAAQVRIRIGGRGGADSVLLHFNNGNGTLLAALPGFIGTVVVERDKVVSVSYVPSHNSPRYQHYQQFIHEVRKRHAYVAAAARFGSFRLELSTAAKMAKYLRQLKYYDPTLGLYAAYAYQQVGAKSSIQSIYSYMSGEREAVPFDVALLAGRLPADGWLLRSPGVAPFVPMLNQGWALLGQVERQLDPLVVAAGECRLSSLWTTYTPTGVRLLARVMKKGQLS